MNAPPSRGRGSSDPGLGFRAFVGLMAALMAINALGIDSMLIALPEIGRSLGVASENERQLIVSFYVFGFGVAQLAWGPLADRFGRRTIVIACTALYGVLSLLVAFSPSFTLLLAARLLQGVAAAASRVLVTSIVRDCYQGRQMARVMSLSFIVFLMVPILAPSIGQGILLATGSWRFIFFFLAAFGGAVALAAALTLKETLHPDFRQRLALRPITASAARTLGDRTSLFYTIAVAASFGALLGYVNSVEQIFADIFHATRIFPLFFAGTAMAMGVAGFVNSRIVERYGSRKVSHTALIGFILTTLIHVAVAASGYETLESFGFFQGTAMFCVGLMNANFGAMAMEPLGDIAGTASSVQGFVSTCLAALFGLAIGQAFDGTIVPLAAGFAIAGLLTLAAVLAAERGRLFRPHHAGAAT